MSRARFLSIVVCFFAVSCASVPQKIAPIEETKTEGAKMDRRLRFPLTKHRFANGLTLLIAPDPDVPVLSYQTWVRAGSVDEVVPRTGIAHLFEHLMFKGTPKFPGKSFFTELEARGAEVNAQTSRDFTQYLIVSAPHLLDRIAEMEADRLMNLTIDEGVLATERAVVFEEMRLRIENSPEGKMQEAIWRLAYDGHPYGTPVIGFPQDLARLTAEELLDFYRSHYQPANVTIVLTGNVDPERAKDVIGKWYGGLEGRPVPERKRPAMLEATGERRVLLHDEVARPKLLQGYRITPADHADTPALDVLANIFFEGRESRFYRKLVLENGSFSTVGGSSYTPWAAGLFTIAGTLAANQGVRQGETAIERAVREVQEKGVTKEEVERAVRQLVVATLDNARTPDGLGEILGLVHVILGDADRFADDFARYFRVTPEDVLRVARVYLQPNNRSTVILLPKNSKEEVL